MQDYTPLLGGYSHRGRLDTIEVHSGLVVRNAHALPTIIGPTSSEASKTDTNCSATLDLPELDIGVPGPLFHSTINFGLLNIVPIYVGVSDNL